MTMTRLAAALGSHLIRIAVLLCLAAPLSHARDAVEHWTATSTTAMSITGNVTFSAGKLGFQNGRSLDLSPMGPVAGFKAMGDAVKAELFRVTQPADPLLKNGNHLCGGSRNLQSVTYIAIWRPEALPGDASPRSMAAFSGATPPRSTDDPTCCGIYNFDLGG